MSQYDDVTTIDPNATSGSALGAIVQALIGHLLSGGYGVGVPADASAGYIGAENTGGTPEAYVFDGTAAVALYSLANAVGAVSADGSGGNTGAIVEIGETSGTLWVKFAGGLAICARRATADSGGVLSWSLPVTFSDTGKMFATGSSTSTSGNRSINCVINTTSSITLRAFTAADVGIGTEILAICIGFWTEEFV